ncbi:hypothetical protein AVW11_01675 [Streptomyces amritsarensis]|uniref:Uncharacterized protein n=1 Tax=Streptomyces amritsarensis TaxID=681158 RepID=A0ABX3GA05_9ACTN|nr:hypothetical protein [Streptomyces amritsarensis]OLZ73810.1 hypothetical protein AVW11_01675 [Streptomyces amritsarensis]
MTTRTKAAPPPTAAAAARRRPGTGRRHLPALPTPLPSGPSGVLRPAGSARKLPSGREGALTAAATGAPAAAPGTPGTPPGAHPACAGDLRRTSPALRPERAPARATTPAAGASLLADGGRAGRETSTGSGLPARDLPAGPAGHCTTGEGA